MRRVPTQASNTSMKHITFKLAMFLVLGAIINIAVAWGGLLWLRSYRPLAQEELIWPVKPPEGFDYSTKYGSGFRFVGKTEFGAWVKTNSEDTGRMDILMA